MSFDGAVVEVRARQVSVHTNRKRAGLLTRMFRGTTESNEHRSIPIKDLVAGEPHLQEAFGVVKRLVDNGTIERITAIQSFHDEPRAYEFYGSGGGGIHFFDKESALWAAIAESLERRIWKSETDYFKNPATLTIAEAVARGGLDPARFAGFSEHQRASLPNLSFTPNAALLWIEGLSHISGKSTLVPAHVVSRAWFGKAVIEARNEPYVRAPITTGLATGRTLEEAALRGFLEVIERDAFMVTYLNQLALPRLDLEELRKTDAHVGEVVSAFKRYRLETHAVLLLTDFNVPVVLSIVIDRTGKGPAISVGAKASFSLKDALMGALSESLAVRLSSRRKEKVPLPQKERFNRKERLAWWADPAQLPLIDPLIRGSLVQPALEGEGGAMSARDQLEQLTQHCKNKGYEAIAVDLSSSTCNVSSLKVAFSIIPELQPLHLDETYPAFGGRRLTEIPREKGYEPRGSVFTEPHPFP